MAKPLGVVLNFYADSKDAVRDIGKLTRSLDRMGDKSKSVGSKMKSMAKAGPLAVAAGLGAAAFAAVDFAKAAYADDQAAQKLERTLLRVAGITEQSAESAGKWIDSMELMTGIADDDLRTALGRLAVVTGDLTEAQDLSALSADAAAGSGKDFAAVFNAMAKAAGGNVNALKRLFPQLDAGPDKVLTLKEAVDQLSESYGGAAKAAEDNDLFGRLATIWGQVKEALGQAALPTLEDLAEWFGDPKNIAAIQDWITKLGDWSRTVGEDFAGQVKDFIDYLKSPEGKAAIDNLSASLVSFGSGAKEAGDQLAPFLTLLGDLLDLYNAIPAPLKGLVGLGEIVGGDAPKPAVTRDDVREAALRNSRQSQRARDVASARPGSAVNVTVINGKQEKSLDSAAMAIRLAKITTNTGR